MKIKKWMAVCLGFILALGSLSFSAYGQPADSGDLYDGKVLLDLNFDDGTTGNFFSYVNGGDFELLNQDQQLACHIKKTGTLDYANQAYLDGFSLTEGCRYRLSFDGWSDAACSLQYRIQLNGGDYHAYAIDQAVMNPELTHYELEFVMEEPTDPAPRLAFNMGMQPDMTEDPGEHTIYFDNILLEVIDAGGAAREAEDAPQILLSINHAGYRPQDVKTIVADGSLAGSSFRITGVDNNLLFDGTFSEAMEDAATGRSVCRGDFTDLTETGSYEVTVSLDDQSVTSQVFEIREDVYEDLTASVLHMLYLQRCGTELDADAAGAYAHPACHTNLAVVYGTDEQKDVSGGWHDAGDYGRYVVSGAQAAADLLYIYEQISPQEELLEEVRYELEWMLKMQDEETGGVYHKVTCANFPGTVMPQDETEPLILAPVSAAATGDFAAVMAMAAGDYRDSDPEFADTCAKAAQTAWQYLMNQSSLEGFHNPPEIVTGEYPDGELKDEVLWAAVELLDLVNQGSLPEDLRSELEQTILSKMEAGMSCGLGWADMGGFALYDLAGTDSENPEIQKVREQAQTQILSEAERIRGLIEQDGYFASMGTNYYWGSNMGIANNGMMLLMAADLTDDPAWKIPAKRQLDYLLGVNGLDFCYVSGVGEKCLSDPHHRPSQAVGEAMPGMLAGGPNPNLEDPYAQQVLSGLAPALCYADNQQSYSTNEVAIYWNSPLLVLLYGIR